MNDVLCACVLVSDATCGGKLSPGTQRLMSHYILS